MPSLVPLYRLSHLLHTHGAPILPRLIQTVIYLVYHAVVPCEVEIGPQVEFAHGGLGVILHPRCQIGRHVYIGAHVVVGGRSRHPGLPRIGNNVYLGAGAKILGDITVGDDVVVGANAVVTRSVPPRTIVAGVPARILRQDVNVQEYEEW